MAKYLYTLTVMEGTVPQIEENKFTNANDFMSNTAAECLSSGMKIKFVRESNIVSDLIDIARDEFKREINKHSDEQAYKIKLCSDVNHYNEINANRGILIYDDLIENKTNMCMYFISRY